ncbi:MAG: PrsW family intramembrane metalloprotease [Candidatus Nealsonbacteria bacterium]|nr:PrsW family intramembrane metalloprotease [Candidatus Nealsonbacteria bacterium]
MNYLLYVALGFLPSLIWLSIYLRKDSHPESNLMILKIFAFGMLVTAPAVLLEIGFFEELKKLSLPSLLTIFMYSIFGVALIEEGLKYLIVKERVLKNPEFDEPIDAMLYMIIVALGFAAVENVLIIFNFGKNSLSSFIFSIAILRFVGATFLHTLSSGTIGYFLARSLFLPKRKLTYMASGFAIAVILHGLYNFSIITADGYSKALIPMAILTSLAFFLTWGFNDLKRLKSVCQPFIKK